MAKRRQQIQRQLKKQAREAKAQARFIESPTPKKARHIAGAEANKEYKPVLRGLRSEVAGSRKREGELKDWYSGLGAQNQQAQQSAAATSQAAESALTQRLSNASASDSSALQAQASQNASLAKLLGGPTNTAGQAEAAKGAQAVAQQRVALTSPLTAERASYGNYLGQRGVSATERGIEARKAETSRRRKIKEDLRAGKKERGQAVVANLEKLREGARDYAIQKQAFGQKGKELGQSAREAALDRSQKARENAADQRISGAKLGLESRKTRTSEAELENETRKTNQAGRKIKKEGKSGGRTPSQVREDKHSNRNAATAARTLYKAAGSPQWSQKQWTIFVQRVAMEDGIDYPEAQRAVAKLRQGSKKPAGFPAPGW